jgi:hypothetical protein
MSQYAQNAHKAQLAVVQNLAFRENATLLIRQNGPTARRQSALRNKRFWRQAF